MWIYVTADFRWGPRNIRWTFLGPIKWNQRSHMFKCLYITQLSYKRMFHNCRTSTINLIFAEIRERRKKWRFSNYIRYEIGTTNVPRCWVPVWRDHIIGPKPWNLKMVIIIPQRHGRTWEGVPVANWISEGICKMRGRLVHHTIIIPPALSLPLLRDDAVGRVPTIFQKYWFCTRICNFFQSPIFRFVGDAADAASFVLVLTHSFVRSHTFYFQGIETFFFEGNWLLSPAFLRKSHKQIIKTLLSKPGQSRASPW